MESVSELVQIWCVVAAALAVMLAVLCLFVTSGSGSNFEHFVDAWKARKVAELEVEKAKVEAEKAKHEMQAKLAEKGLFIREQA